MDSKKVTVEAANCFWCGSDIVQGSCSNCGTKPDKTAES